MSAQEGAGDPGSRDIQGGQVAISMGETVQPTALPAADWDMAADLGGEQDPIATRRLVQADRLVREGKARLEEPFLVIPLEEGADLGVIVAYPLPPAPLEPELRVRLAETVCGGAVCERFFQAVKSLFSDLLSGPVTLKMQPSLADFRWSPRPVSSHVEAQPRFLALAEHLHQAVQQLCCGEDLDQVVAHLRDTMNGCQQRGERLSQQFANYALLRLWQVGLIHLLAYRTVAGKEDEPLLLAGLTNADLWSPATGRGFYVAIRLLAVPEEPIRSRLASRLIDVIGNRFGLLLEESDEYELLGDWQEYERTCLLWAPGDRALRFEPFLLSVRGLVRFLGSLLDLVQKGADPLDLLGARPRTMARSTSREPDGGLAVGEADGQARPARFEGGERPEWKATLEKLEAAVGDLPADEEPAERQKLPEPSSLARQNRREPITIDSMTAREVVKKLGAEEPRDMDVFLTHPGYNVKKTVDIMSVALSMTAEEATAICERAPCLIVGPVTRTKAATLKTILEGTGARIRVVTTGSQEE
ncbi:MAG: hypothetical protein JW797_05400 [Bradymonadales bacterium]|nr:hypothetical protein [Bradymonadales bacterium]